MKSGPKYDKFVYFSVQNNIYIKMTCKHSVYLHIKPINVF